MSRSRRRSFRERTAAASPWPPDYDWPPPPPHPEDYSPPPHLGDAGVGIDARGGPVVDPTANVVALVKAEALAAARLREADIRYNSAMHSHLKEIGILRASNAETLRVSDLDRLDKTRQVDVLAGTASAAALATAVQTLANTSDRNAETLRNLVNATAATMAKQTSDQAATLSAQTDSLVRDINARIAELQKSNYQGVGKSEGVSDSAKLLVGVLTIIALILGFYTFTQREERTAPPAPQVIYVPAPAGSLLPTAPPAPAPR